MPLPTATEYPGSPGPEYDWSPQDPEAAAVARTALAVYSKQIDVVSQARKAAEEFLSAVSKLTDALGYVEALNMTSRASLYPFPEPGNIAGVSILELRAALQASQTIVGFLMTTIAVEDVGTVRIVDCLRRIV